MGTVPDVAALWQLGLVEEARALMRLSPNPVVSWVSALYVWVFRGIPPLALILFVYFLGALQPTLSLGIPFGPTILSGSTNDLVTQFVAATIA